MKVYLVSEVKCYNDESMSKNFEVFSTEEDAIKYKDWLVENWIEDLMEGHNVETIEDLETYIEITYDMNHIWGFLNEDYSEEVEIEVTELDLSSIK